MNFNPNVSGSQRACTSIDARDYGENLNVASIEVKPAFYSNCNTVYFDNVQVSSEDFGGSKKYNANANVRRVTDNVGENTGFKYDIGKRKPKNITLPSGEIITKTYDNSQNPQNLKTSVSPITDNRNVKSEFNYDTYGNVIHSEFSAEFGSEKINSDTTYSVNKDFNYPEEATDSRGFKTYFDYNKNNGHLLSTTLQKDDTTDLTTEYGYDAAGRMTSVSSDGAQTNYTYSNGALSKITSPIGVAYNFVRDIFGKIMQSKVGNQVLTTNKYDAGNGNLREVKYNNNQIARFDYDKLERMTKKQELAGKRKAEFEYIYDDKNRLVQTFDSENNLTIKVEYDTFGRVTHIRRSDDVSGDFTFNNERNVVAKAILKLFGISQTINNTFGTSNMLEKSDFTCNGISSEHKYNYDDLGRVQENESLSGTSGVKHEISYVEGNQSNSTTSLIDSVQATNTGSTLDKKFSYKYDGLGNITEIKENNVTKAEYFYDNLNRLEKENNGYLGETVKYEYDFGGNIKTKKFYTDETETTLKKTVTYKYLDSNWKDKLTSYKIVYEAAFIPQGEEAIQEHKIIYDGIGNSTEYTNGWKFKWIRGKRLDKALNSCYNIEYKYDDAGVRTQKTVNGVNTNFVTNGTQVLAQKTGDDIITWQIDGNGSIVGFNRNNIQHFYLKNAQGDIIGITNANGDVIVEYTYDSWGKLVLINDTSGCNIGEINPLRYRGYYYDTETELYYLNARYYDPETGRFVNADDNLEGGLNLYAYCLNNPVMLVDRTGNMPGDLFNTPDEAAADFGMCFNGPSINQNKEFASTIYLLPTGKFSYTVPQIGAKDSLNIEYQTHNLTNEPFSLVSGKYYPMVAAIHSHGAYIFGADSDNFSQEDKDASITGFRRPLYLVSPNGHLQKYDGVTRITTLLSTAMPRDPDYGKFWSGFKKIFF